MTATYTWDVFTTLDGFGSYNAHGDWGGYWGKQGPEFLDRRVAQYGEELRLVLGANTFRMFQRFLGTLTRDSETIDPVNTRMKHQPTTVLSSTLEEPLDWPDATLARGDAADVIARLKDESELSLRSQRQPRAEPGPHGRRPRRPAPSDDLPGDQRPNRRRTDLRPCRRLRPRADRESYARRPYPRTPLPSNPTSLTEHREKNHHVLGRAGAAGRRYATR